MTHHTNATASGTRGRDVRDNVDSAVAGWMVLIGFALLIGGGFVFDAGMHCGGAAMMLVGGLCVAPAFRSDDTSSTHRGQAGEGE
jgi:hypothetical protein